jgi:hypothetical protein
LSKEFREDLLELLILIDVNFHLHIKSTAQKNTNLMSTKESDDFPAFEIV